MDDFTQITIGLCSIGVNSWNYLHIIGIHFNSFKVNSASNAGLLYELNCRPSLRKPDRSCKGKQLTLLKDLSGNPMLSAHILVAKCRTILDYILSCIFHLIQVMLVFF